MLSLDDINKLKQKKYRTELGWFLVEGEHLVLELHKALEQRPELADSQLLVTEAYQDFASPLSKKLISQKQMARLSDTKTPPGILAVVPMLPAMTDASDRAVYLHEIQDPGNLGTILRTLAWFGGFRCLLSANSVDPYNPKVVRSSMGAIFHVAIEQDVAFDTLADRYGSLAVLDMQGKALSSAEFSDHACYLFGNEARGVPAELLAQVATNRYTIAGSGAIESLNLASAVNMCLYELNRPKS